MIDSRSNMEGITTLFFIVKILLLLPLLLGFSVPAIAHNEANGGAGSHVDEEGIPINYCVFGKAKQTHCFKSDK